MFFCTLILNATIDFKHAVLHTRLLRNWHENQPHDITSGEKNSRVAVRAESELHGTQEIVGAGLLDPTWPRAAAATVSTSVFGRDSLSESTEIRDSSFTSTRTSARPEPAVQEDPSQAPVRSQAPAVPLVNVRYDPVGRLYHLN